MKKVLKKILNNLGIEVRIKPKFGKVLNFDDIYKLKIKKNNPIIFDVGANKGQSIERFKKTLNNPKIFSFEPNPEIFSQSFEKYKNDKDIFLNNLALGDRNCSIPLNVTINSGNSSFYDLKKDTEWIKIRSKQFNTNPENFVEKQVIVNCSTLDNFCLENNIKNIDLLKIDTQGFEDKVLNGAKNLIKNKEVKFIELEIMLDEVYDKTMTFHEIESHLENNYKLYGIDYQGFKNLSEGYMFAVDVLYIKK